MSRLVLWVLVLVAAAACSATPRVLTEIDAENVVTGLCDALAQDDVAASEASFYDLAHTPLHTIAALLTQADETVLAADLLRAKQRVEASYEQDLPVDVLHANLRSLHDVAREALQQFDHEVPTTCEEAG